MPGDAVSRTPTWGVPVTVGRAVFLMVGLPRWMNALGHLLLVRGDGPLVVAAAER